MHEKDIFCKIVEKEIPTDFIMEEENWVAFKDIRPSAPVHVLIVPKRHIAYLEDAKDSDRELLGELLLAVHKVAEKLGLAEGGYRIAINQKEDGGQIVPHL